MVRQQYEKHDHHDEHDNDDNDDYNDDNDLNNNRGRYCSYDYDSACCRSPRL